MAAFCHVLRVRYAEVDYQGIVYFAHYATYFDVAIHEFFRSLPYDYTAIRTDHGRTSTSCAPWSNTGGRCASTRLSRSRSRSTAIGRTSLTFAPTIRVAGEARAPRHGRGRVGPCRSGRPCAPYPCRKAVAVAGERHDARSPPASE